MASDAKSPGTGNETTHLNAEVSPVNVVTEEEIPRGLGVATNLEELHQIILGVTTPSMHGPSVTGSNRLTYCPWMSPQTEGSAGQTQRVSY